MNKIDLRRLFLGLQSQMIAQLSTNRENIHHPGTKGDASELQWRGVLENYLPKRYKVERAHILDCEGALSEQIDVVIFDQQYSPFLFNQDSVMYVPAESVYAVLEVKQDLGKHEIDEAGGKAASVRRLRRTSAPIPHAGGVYAPKVPPHILAGILTLGCTWNPSLGESFVASLKGLSSESRLDFGCSLQFGSFDVTYPEHEKPSITTSTQDDSLIFFFLRLLLRLQQAATAPMLDITAYAKSL